MTTATSGPLVRPEALAPLAGSPGCVIVDCRFDLARPAAGEAAWRAGHVPGAHYAHLDRDLSGPVTPATGRHPLPDPWHLAATLSLWGVGPGTLVVAYDDAGGAIAARLWWLLRWLGHARVALLDGGFQAWVAAGLPVTAEPPPQRPARFDGAPGHMPAIDTAALAQRLRAGTAPLLLDARAPARFRGEQEPIDPVAGHVPGAVNAPFQSFLDGSGRFRPPAELRALFAPLLDGRPATAAAVMCGSGVTACHALVAMELAGLPGAALYAGSWSEWIRSPERPVARG